MLLENKCSRESVKMHQQCLSMSCLEVTGRVVISSKQPGDPKKSRVRGTTCTSQHEWMHLQLPFALLSFLASAPLF